MAANRIIKISNPVIKPHNCNIAPGLKISLKAVLLSCINSSNNGKITGNPKMATSAALCCAFAAMALINVKTRLILNPPNNTIPVKVKILLTGLFKKIKNKTRLIRLINIMMIPLYSIFATI